MSHLRLRREPAEGLLSPRPAAYLVDAMVAVLDGEPDRGVEIQPGLYVRAAYVVQLLAPEALQRADAYVNQRPEIEPQSIRADLVELVGAYTNGGTAA